MRPVKLTMTAFGSYKNETVVDFSELNQSLFLITGDTGAGKTTIFDAMVYALYGEASGNQRERDMLHCDKVPKNEKTVVKLEFLQDGKNYTVMRSFYFQKVRGKTDEYGKSVESAEFLEEGKDPIEGPGKVTDCCINTVGMNAEQFRKIVMLAQGEFKDFLTSKSENKRAILSKLFDSSKYQYLQNLLYEARKKIDGLRNVKTADLEKLMEETFIWPEYEGEAEKEPDWVFGFSSTCPELEDNLKELIGHEKESEKDIGQRRDACQGKIDKLNKEIGAAETMNGLIDDLASKKTSLSEMETVKPAMDKRRVEYGELANAYHIVKPEMDRLKENAEQTSQTEQNIFSLKTRISELGEDRKQAEKMIDDDKPAKERIERINAEIKRIEDLIPRFDEQEKNEKDYESAITDSETAKEELAKKEKTKTSLSEEIKTLEIELESLKGADGNVVSCKTEKERAEKAYESLTGIMDDASEVSRHEEEYADNAKKLTDLSATALEASNKYHDLYNAFIAGQAGLLADELRKSIDRDGEAECPVCHTKHCKGHVSVFATAPEGTPSQDDVEEAKDNFDSAEEDRKKQENENCIFLAKIEEKKKTILKTAKEQMPDCTSWENLVSDGWLDEKETEFKEISDNAVEAYRLAVEAAKREKEVEQTLKDRKNDMQDLQPEIDDLNNKKQDLITKATGLKAKIEELQKHLGYSSREEAQANKTEKENERDSLKAVVDSHISALEEINGKISSAEGELKQAESRKKDLEQKHGGIEDAFYKALEKAGIASPEKAEELLDQLDFNDPEAWLREESTELNKFFNDLENTKKAIEDLSAKTKGKTKTDLDVLNSRNVELSGEKDTLEESLTKVKSLIRNHNEVLRQVHEIKNFLKTTEKAWKKIDRIGSAAQGRSDSADGKISFDIYALGQVFNQVLEMGNIRLDEMSGGLYQMEHKVGADRRNSAAGLDIMIRDSSSGELREVGSLSGGESFVTSLALALGLSDVVQNHAGGKSLEALFVDEGFGSLDDDYLDKALGLLNGLTEGNRLVGVISHIHRLEESIPQKMKVIKGTNGSRIEIEV